jgi:glucose-6-phosphate 1-dehydrogenase
MSSHTSTYERTTVPTVFVVFGITGDLFRKKIARAFYNLYCDELLPHQFQIIGVAHSVYDDQSIREYVGDVLRSVIDPDKQHRIDEFVQRFYYHQASFDDATAYRSLGERLGQVDGEWKTCANKLFYLSVSPMWYETILDELASSGLTQPCSADEGWTRVILEKPFGTDMNSAEKLDMHLAELFREEQIYRVDHYLAKETARNIMAFRFSNQIFAPAWNNESIESIEIRMHEEIDVADRGQFYDGVGALRDVGQNHLLQLLALFTMENPQSFAADAVRAARAKALSHVKKLSPSEVPSHATRAQYEGFRGTNGVANDSDTETYFRLQTTMDGGPFEGVPVLLESGKALSDSLVEITVTFRHLSPCFCREGEHKKNVLRYSVQPEETITIELLVKQPGHDYELVGRDFEMQYQDDDSDIVVLPYQQLLLDIIVGDQTLFVSTDEIQRQWEIVQPILNAWHESSAPVPTYKKGELPNI